MADTDTHAGVGRRFVAQVIDLVVLFVLAYLIAVVTGDTTSSGFQIEGGPAFLWFAIVGLYFIALEGMYGQTVGKRLSGIVVITEDLTAIDLRAALIRNVLRLIDGFVFYAIGLVLILLSDRGQRLGDRVADTVVVRTE